MTMLMDNCCQLIEVQLCLMGKNPKVGNPIKYLYTMDYHKYLENKTHNTQPHRNKRVLGYFNQIFFLNLALSSQMVSRRHEAVMVSSVTNLHFHYFFLYKSLVNLLYHTYVLFPNEKYLFVQIYNAQKLARNK